VHDFVRLLRCDEQGIIGDETEISGGAQLDINMRGVLPGTLRHFFRPSPATATHRRKYHLIIITNIE